jgi:hypothetical protein
LIIFYKGGGRRGNLGSPTKLIFFPLYISFKMELLPWINETKLDWHILSCNLNAIELLMENFDKINWKMLCLKIQMR